uniref:Microfibril associated protein 5 n=1 Tax=Mastacembelus armatus TaxID=205130 RepID=A0A7N8XRU7_9TELE
PCFQRARSHLLQLSCHPVSDSRLDLTPELPVRRPCELLALSSACFLFLLEEMYACTRMYSVHRPIKRCIGKLCFYSLPRVYLINNEICTRTVCQQDEYMKAERCRELSGWPKRVERSLNMKFCRNRRSNPPTWANKV